ALLAGVLQGIFASHVPTAGGTPAMTLRHVNEVVLRRTTESRLATLVYGRLDATGRLTYCNGGHTPPMLIGEHRRHRLDQGGLILGAFRGAKCEEASAPLDA